MNSQLSDNILHNEKLLLSYGQLTTSQLDGLVDDEFIEFGQSGSLWTKEDLLKCCSRLESSADTVMMDVNVKPIDKNVLLVTYRATQTIIDVEEPEYSLRSSLWRCSDNTWKIVFHQGTPLPNR